MASDLGKIPFIGGFLDDSGDDLLKALREATGVYQDIQLPDVQFEQYNPEMAQAERISEDPAVRNRQLALLDQMGRASESGMTDADIASYELGTQRAQRGARQTSEALINESKRRGVGGSGLEFALREQGNQDALTRASDANLQQSADSARQRALYSQMYGNTLSGVRDADYRPNAANVAAANQFNLANTMARNQGQQYNIENKRNVQQTNFQNKMSKAGGVAGGLTGQAQGYGALNAANAAQRQGLEQLIAGAAMGAAGFGPWAAGATTKTPKKPQD
jgi:hypothetical protein